MKEVFSKIAKRGRALILLRLISEEEKEVFSKLFTFRARIETTAKEVASRFAVAAVWLVLLGLGFALFEQVEPWARDQYENWIEGDPYLKVWVNPEAKVYYAPGDKAFGNTLPGFYASQADARSAGYKSTNAWDVGFGTSARPLRTNTDVRPFADSGLSWTDGSVTLYLHNNSEWEIRDVTIWISVESGPQKTYRLTGQAMPKTEAVLQLFVTDSPGERKKVMWSWGFSKVRGFPP